MIILFCYRKLRFKNMQWILQIWEKAPDRNISGAGFVIRCISVLF